MKKMLLIISAALGIHALNGMQIAQKNNPTEEHTIKEFSISSYIFGDTRDGICRKLDTTLDLAMPDRTQKQYKVFDILKGALPQSLSISATSLGNRYAHALFTIFKATKINSKGEIDFYDSIHKFREVYKLLMPLIKPLDEEEQNTEKSSSIPTKPMPRGPQTSGLGLAWVMPTLKYSTTFLGGVGALALYQQYRAR